jgi:predicted alpha/beta superfamily hydrolase
MLTSQPHGGGVLHRHHDLPSRYVAPRHVDIWCPPGCDTRGRRFPVIYLHDGQNLFVPELAFVGVDWGADEAVERLIGEGRTGGAIIVGIWNTPERMAEYLPQAPIEAAPLSQRDAIFQQTGALPISNRYLAFLVEELKPLVDASYPTLPDQASTFVAGSSMGGLISLYALARYPQVFGGAACLSTHWPIAPDALLGYFVKQLPPPRAHRLYFDYGTEGIDAYYEPFQQRMDAQLGAAGYRQGGDWLTLRFPGADHTEAAWRARLHLPLAFLLAETAR